MSLRCPRTEILIMTTELFGSGVKNDEVAILAVSTRWRHLHFPVPEALKNVGFIPLSSNSALAVRTARDSRPEIENNFANSRHATIFETVKISADAASRK